MSDELIARLRASAKMLRSFSRGIVGDARHWAKDCAADCDTAASALSLALKREETMRDVCEIADRLTANPAHGTQGWVDDYNALIDALSKLDSLSGVGRKEE